ncbi:TIGR00730 family Rossman fold protein [Methylocystis parvus]|uniref:AMP nucleosidase n=1 Tax=Methylocystis parvus TaxID=134 RepID=A0A6B8M4F3_9HYPH|nr:TIGR00730 family Rossman fold protein [Methylocystis parvus]QGM97205.1 TIGR00730 family Rossman fold protein [Methylocystis parvus]WBJ98888.1 TIGR00730 family Rossman fold protein [Methylocystis parvus OBBP]
MSREEEGASREPNPPNPVLRAEPLPEERPKPAHEDPEAAQRVAALLSSPAYREADSDFAFLDSDDARGPRLELDYLKAELLLRRHGITGGVVVFGSTRIVEPATAAARLAEARDAARVRPDDAEAARRLRIAERVAQKAPYYQIARDLGRIVGEAGMRREGGRLAIVTGGGPGIMEAANRGAFDAGAPNVGLNISLRREQFPNPYVTPELCFRFHYFAMRKLHFMLRAQALVAFPGGYGTLDELFETLTLAQTRVTKPMPIVLVGEAYWRRVFDPDFLVEEGVITPEDRGLFWYAETADDIWNGILRWREKAGDPLL